MGQGHDFSVGATRRNGDRGDGVGEAEKPDLSMETRWAAWRPSLRNFPMAAAEGGGAGGRAAAAASDQTVQCEIHQVATLVGLVAVCDSATFHGPLQGPIILIGSCPNVQPTYYSLYLSLIIVKEFLRYFFQNNHHLTKCLLLGFAKSKCASWNARYARNQPKIISVGLTHAIFRV